MALWDNTGDTSDIVNLYADMFGDGTLMDSFRAKMAREKPMQEAQAERDLQAVCRRVKATKVRKVENSTGLTAVASIPTKLYHDMAIVFRMRAEEMGITLESNGYECWQDEHFLNHLRKHPKYQYLFYKEAARNARIIVNEPKPMPGGLIVSAA